jgi:aspartyl-tRNA(Asn)/glutamyl-tRNA(Gln) amidotransferase subunit C
MQDTITLETTRKIAKLSRLKLTEAELIKYTQDLTSILGYVEQLKEVNTDGIEPLIHGFALQDHFREDTVEALSEREIKNILACSDQVLYEQFKVPQVLGES